MTVKLSQERKVRSLAKKTLGSTRVGRAIRFPKHEVGWLNGGEVGREGGRQRRDCRVGGLVGVGGGWWRRG